MQVRNVGESITSTTSEKFKNLSQPAFTCSKLTMETPEQCDNV